MGYLHDTYGYRSEEFVAGVMAGIRQYAVWHDGEQFVGVMRTPLRVAHNEVKRELLKDYKEYFSEENKND